MPQVNLFGEEVFDEYVLSYNTGVGGCFSITGTATPTTGGYTPCSEAGRRRKGPALHGETDLVTALVDNPRVVSGGEKCRGNAREVLRRLVRR